MNYRLEVESVEGQQNAPVTLLINAGPLSVGQEKHTTLFWRDPTIIFEEDWEAGDFNDWDNTNMIIATDQQHTPAGSNSAKCQTTDKAGLDCDLISTVSLDTSSYQSINVSFWYMDDDCDGGAGDDANLYLNDTDGNWDYIEDIDAGTLGTSDDVWNKYIYTSSDSQYLHSGFAIWYDFNLEKVENYWIDDVNISGTAIPPTVEWNQSALEMGESANNITGASIIITSGGANTNVKVQCRGDCDEVHHNWTTKNTGSGDQDKINFTCSNLTDGVFAADFNVTSDEDTSSDFFNVTCEIYSYGWLSVNISSPREDSSYAFTNTNLTLNSTVTCNAKSGKTNARCGTVYANARYNLTANPDTFINVTNGATPFYIVDAGYGFNGTYINKTDGFATQAAEVWGITTNGTDIWVTSQTGTGTAYRHYMDGTYSGQSFGLTASGARDITNNGTHLFVAASGDDQIWRYTMAGVKEGGGFDTLASGNGAPYGLGTNDTDFWVADAEDKLAYHYDKDGNNITDGFDLATGDCGAARGLTVNGTEFWASDATYKLVCHFNSSGDNQTDGFGVAQFGITDGHGITTNGTDFWIVDDGVNAVFHLARAYGPLLVNPQTKTMNQGDVWQPNWTMNVTTRTASTYLVDVLFNSSYGSESITDNDTDDKQIIITNTYGWLNVSISAPVEDSGYAFTNTNLTLNATVTCVGGPCETVYANARYNLTINPDSFISTTEATTPFYISGAGEATGTVYWRPVNWSGTGTGQQNAGDRRYNDTLTFVDTPALGTNYTFNLTSDVTSIKLFTTSSIGGGSEATIFLYNWLTKIWDIQVKNKKITAVTNITLIEDTTSYVNSNNQILVLANGTGGIGGINIYDIHITTIGGGTYDFWGIENPSVTMNATSEDGGTCTTEWCAGDGELSSVEYYEINQSDNNYSTTSHVDAAYHLFHFKIDESSSDIDNIVIDWEGYDSVATSKMYIWNSSGWNLIGTKSTNLDDNRSLHKEITTLMSTYIDSNNYLHLKVNFTAEAGSTAYTDYVKVNVITSSGTTENPQSLTMNAGDVWKMNWTMNVTSKTAESYLLDVLFNSSVGSSGITENSTDDKQIRLNHVEAGGPQSLTEKILQLFSIFQKRGGNGIFFINKILSIIFNTMVYQFKAVFNTIVQSVNLENVVFRLSALFATLMQSLSLLVALLTPQKLARDYPQQINIENRIDSMYGAERGTLQNIVFGSAFYLFKVVPQDIIQNINLNAMDDRVLDLIRNFQQQVSLDQLAERLSLLFRLMAQKTTLDNLVDRTASLFKIPTQNILFNNIVSRLSDSFRDFTQNISINTIIDATGIKKYIELIVQNISLDNIVSRLSNVLRNVVQALNLNILVDKFKVVVYVITQIIDVNNITSRLSSIIESVVQIFDIDNTISRIFNGFRNFIQNVDTNGFVYVFKVSFQKIIQIFDVDDVVIRLSELFRNFTQNILMNIVNAVSSTNNYFVSIVQSINFNQIVDTFLDLIRRILQFFNIFIETKAESDLYLVDIISPNTTSPESVSQGDNITIYFNFTKFSDPITANVNVTNVSVGSTECDILSSDTATIQLQDADIENVEDTYISQEVPTADLGANTNIALKKTTSSVDYDGMIKFNISSLYDIQEIVNMQVYLYLYQNGLDDGTEGFDISVHHVYSYPLYNISYQDWSEGNNTLIQAGTCISNEMCWNVMPSESSQFNSTSEDSVSFLGTTSIGWVTWDVTDMIYSELNESDLNISIYFDANNVFGTPSAADRLYFYSKEYTGDISLRPYLNIVYNTDNTKEIWYNSTTKLWGVNCTIPSGTGTNDLTIEVNYTTDNVNRTNTETEAISYISAASANVVLSIILSNIADKLSDLGKDVVGSFNLNSIASKFTGLFEEMVQLLNLSNLANKFTGFFNDLTQNIAISGLADKVSLFFGNVVQILDIDNVVSRLGNLFKGVTQNINLNNLTERVGNIFKNITQSLDIDNLTLRVTSLFKTILQSIALFFSLFTPKSVTENIGQQIDISQDSSYLREVWRGILQQIDITGISERLFVGIRGIVQPIAFTILNLATSVGKNVANIIQILNFENLAERISDLSRSFTQAFNIDNLVFKFKGVFSSIVQVLNIENIVDKFSSLFENIIQIFSINNLAERLGVTFRDISQVINLDFIVGISTVKQYIEAIVQALNIDDVVSRLGNLFRNTIQIISLDNLTSTVRNFFRDAIQNLNLNGIMERVGKLFRNLTQIISLDGIVDKFSLALKNIVQIIDVDGNISRWFVGIRDFVQNILVNGEINASTFNRYVMKIIQALNLDGLIERFSILQREFIQILNVGGVVDTFVGIFEQFTQSISFDGIMEKLREIGVEVAQKINFSQIVDNLSKFIRNIFGFFAIFSKAIGSIVGVPPTTPPSGGDGIGLPLNITLDHLYVTTEDVWIFGEKHYIFVSPLDKEDNMVDLNNISIELLGETVFEKTNTLLLSEGRYKKGFMIDLQDIDSVEFEIIAKQNTKEIKEKITVEIRDGTFVEKIIHKAKNVIINVVGWVLAKILYIVAFFSLAIVVLVIVLYKRRTKGR